MASALLKQFRSRVKAAIVDFHAESVDEKEALALSLDGEVSAVVGTHTHVQTADERILPRGTAYITDIGMTGPVDSVIGMKKETAVSRSLTQMPLKMEVQNSTGGDPGSPRGDRPRHGLCHQDREDSAAVVSVTCPPARCR